MGCLEEMTPDELRALDGKALYDCVMADTREASLLGPYSIPFTPRRNGAGILVAIAPFDWDFMWGIGAKTTRFDGVPADWKTWWICLLPGIAVSVWWLSHDRKEETDG
jgi:hypothetical protein